MLDPKTLEEIGTKVSALIANSPAKDFEKNAKAVMSGVFARLDLVTREEFDVQQLVLLRSREKLEALEKRLAQLEMGLVVEDSALAELAKAGFDPVFGARPLKRAIQQQIENPLARAILEGKFAAKDTIRVSCTNGIVRFAKD